MSGALLFCSHSLEGWVEQDRILYDEAAIDNLMPGEIVRVSTWLIIPAWTPLVVLEDAVRGGRSYRHVLYGTRDAWIEDDR